MKILVVDIGGNNVKVKVTGHDEKRKFSSSPTLSAPTMVDEVKQITGDWEYEAVSIGFPGPVRNDRPIYEPINLGEGWVDYDYEAAFGHPVKMINDAAMQALGSYDGGTMLFLGFGTGLGTTLISNHTVVPMELAHLPYKKSKTFEDYVGKRGLDRLGKKQWSREVARVIDMLRDTFHPEYIVLGGGNTKKLKTLPPGVQVGDNENAFIGGFRLWGEENPG